jgi:hypothetical protein
MNVRKQKRLEREYQESHKEQLEQAEKERIERITKIYESTKDPEKRYWEPGFNETLKHAPNIGWGATIWNAIKRLKETYIARGWMNEKGEWV